MTEPGGAAGAMYKDRRTGLVLFGVLEILIGLFALAGAGFSSIALVLAPAGATPPGGRGVVAGIALYLLAAAFFIAIGIGSILARRWARALMLVVSWIWLAVGVLSLVAMVFLVPKMRSMMDRAFAQAAAQHPQAGPTPDPALIGTVMLGCVVVGVVLFYLVLPALFVLFYRSPNVRATCEARHPRPSWTDRIPLPVLALVLLQGFGALSVPGTVLAYGAFSVFGLVLTGTRAWLLAAVLTTILAFAARWSWRLEPRGWWLSLGLWVFGLASTVGMLLYPLDWNELSRAMGIDPSVYADLGLESWMRQMPWLTLITLVPWLAWLLWVRRFFTRPEPTPEVPTPEVPAK